MLALHWKGHGLGHSQHAENPPQGGAAQGVVGRALANLNGDRYLRCLTKDISSAGARVSIDEQFLDKSADFLDPQPLRL